jgi:hypothetical protein
MFPRGLPCALGCGGMCVWLQMYTCTFPPSTMHDHAPPMVHAVFTPVARPRATQGEGPACYLSYTRRTRAPCSSTQCRRSVVAVSSSAPCATRQCRRVPVSLLLSGLCMSIRHVPPSPCICACRASTQPPCIDVHILTTRLDRTPYRREKLRREDLRREKLRREGLRREKLRREDMRREDWRREDIDCTPTHPPTHPSTCTHSPHTHHTPHTTHQARELELELEGERDGGKGR